MDEIKDSEFNYAVQLNKDGFLPGFMNCKSGAKIFYIQHEKFNKASGVCFQCTNNKCKLKYPIRINSLYSKFPLFKLKDFMEIINCFLCLEMNANKAFKYLNENKKIKNSLRALLNVYLELI